MEARRRRSRVRNPFSDCTNTVSTAAATATATSSQSSSASTATLKRENPKLSSVAKNLLSALNPKPSELPPSIPSTPARAPPASSAASGTSEPAEPSSVYTRRPGAKKRASTGKENEPSEPCSVYTRRPSATKRTSAGKEDVGPWSCPPAPKIRKTGDKTKESEKNSLSKEFTAPRKKRQRSTTEDVSKYALPQDFIEKQRAYFADIDAFELLEEEVDDEQLQPPEEKDD